MGGRSFLAFKEPGSSRLAARPKERCGKRGGALKAAAKRRRRYALRRPAAALRRAIQRAGGTATAQKCGHHEGEGWREASTLTQRSQW
jgi:hypothetical protein